MRFRYSTNEKGKLVKKALVYTSQEHGIDVSNVDPQAVFVIERLWANGFETYIVGGAVRDLILGKKPKDFDIVSAANPARIKKLFRNARIIGNRFRLVHVYFGPKTFEVSTFRSLKDGPTSNTFGSIEEDVLRRDFTLNALFFDPINQVVVDFVGGMKDIKAKKVRPIIALSSIFTDDPVRMIRAVKYGAITGFALSLQLRWKIRQQSSLLSTISASRLTEEIFKIIHSPMTSRIVDELDAAGLYQYIQPQAAMLFKTKQGFREQYLRSLSTLDQREFKNRPGEAMAALIRDYLEDIADWTGSGVRPAWERYREAFMAARKFVMPMNPPRVQLGQAVKLLFAEHGVKIKRSRLSENNPKSTMDGKQAKDNNENHVEEPDSPVKKKSRSRHSRRKRKSVRDPELYPEKTMPAD